MVLNIGDRVKCKWTLNPAENLNEVDDVDSFDYPKVGGTFIELLF
jgi:hypothetical protein